MPDPLPNPGEDPGADWLDPDGPGTGLIIMQDHAGPHSIWGLAKSGGWAVAFAGLADDCREYAKQLQEAGDIWGAGIMLDMASAFDMASAYAEDGDDDPPQLAFDRTINIPGRPRMPMIAKGDMKALGQALIASAAKLQALEEACLESLERSKGAHSVRSRGWMWRHIRTLVQCREYIKTEMKNYNALLSRFKSEHSTKPKKPKSKA